MKFKNFIYLFLVFTLVSACGGGGSGDSAPTPSPTVNLSAQPTSVLLGNTSTLTWNSTNASSCSASWTSSTSTSGSEAVTINEPGNNNFSISCSGAGGNGSASVTVEGYRNTDGVVVDGYISGADVFIDENDNWTADATENSTTSDNDGKFTIKYANGNLVSIGGTDLDSQTLLDNLLITHKLTGHSDFKAVTPVTSIAAFMEDSSLINTVLGIDSSIDVFTFDPVANKGDGGINDYLYEKGNQLTVLAFALQNITNNINTTTETTQDYFKAITEEIEKEYTETETKVDIETEAFITKALDNVIAAKSVTIDETAKSNTIKALAGVMPVIEVKSSDDLTTAVIRFGISTLQTDIQAIANGTATAETVTSYTSDVLAYIAEDQNIDADEIAPDISAIADSATTSEDTAVEINVLLNDSYLTSSPISVTVGNATNGTTSVASNVVTYDPDTDYNGTDTFSYTITQGDKTSSADVTVTIEAINDAPSIDVASTIQVAENQTAVTTVSVSDVDEDELTLTLGGTDADSFNLSDENVLTFKEAPDYETKTSYSITLTLTDGTETVTKEVTIAITNVNDVAPEFTSDATFSAAENQTAIGTVTATDAEGDEVTFTISGDELAITSAGVLTFVSAPDYETTTSYSATVTASDGTNSTTQEITVNVTNVNDVAPEFTSDATFSAAENQTAIGTVTATDAEGDEVTFTISGDELAITSAGVLTFVSAPDYETKDAYTATVTASDGTNSTTQSITVNVTDVNEAPAFTSPVTFSAAENQTAIGTVAASDVDGDTITYSISGSDITINSSSGVITFASAPDYETKTSYTATVTASDGTNTTTQDISVAVTNIREGLIDYTYKITNGTEDIAPRLQASVQFDDLLTVDKVIFRLRMDHRTFNHGIKSFTATKIDSNTWTIDEALSSKLNPAYSYYVNVFYESGPNGSNFSGIASRPKEGSNWKFLQAATAADVGALSIDNAAQLDDTSVYLKFTNSNSKVDTTSPGFQSYLSLSDSTTFITDQEDAIVISGNDGDPNTPIKISIKMLFDEKVYIATDRSRNYTPSGSSFIWNTAETSINGREVTWTWTLSSTSGTYRFRPYIFVYDEALNRTRIELESVDFTNSITDIDHPGVSSIQFATSLGDDKEKYIDYDFQFEDPEDLSRLNLTFRGPQCGLIYAHFHDYNNDPSQKTLEYMGKYRLLDNQRDGIYRINNSLTAYDADNNLLVIENDTLKDTLGITPLVLDADPSQANDLYCPKFTTNNRNIDLSEGESRVVSYENTIQDAYGGIITPKFSLGGDDAALFNISDSGVVTFISPPDFENPLSADGDNRYEVAVRIYSTNGDSDYVPGATHYLQDSFNVKVNNLAWESSSGSIIHPDFLYKLNIVEGQGEWQIVLGYEYTDEGVIDASISGPDAEWFSIKVYPGHLVFLTPTKTLSCDVKQSFNITLTISNGTSTISEDITLSLYKDTDGYIFGTSVPTYVSCPTSDLYWEANNLGKWIELNDYFYKTSNYISNGAALADTVLSRYKNAISEIGTSITYSISGEDASRFVAAESSVGNFCDGCNHNYADYEYKSSYSLTITANDGTNSISRDVEINVDNKNDNLTIFTSPTSYQFSGSDQKIGTIEFYDKDWPSNPPAADACNGYPCYDLYIENKDDAASFYLDGNDLYFAGTPTKPDYSINLIIDSVYPYYINSGNTTDDYNLRYTTQTLSIVNTDFQ